MNIDSEKENPVPGASAVTAVGESHRIPSLDGLRAVSIVGVLVGHLCLSVPGLFPDRVFESAREAARLGVELFFVISGFLITGLLRQEFAKYGSISLPRFYFRRGLRIFPAYYTMILAVFILGKIGYIPVPAGDITRAVTYTFNYLLLHGTSYDHEALAHTWSLAVEEQFYLVWPGLVCLLGWRWSMRGAAGLIAGLAMGRFVFSRFLHDPVTLQALPSLGFDVIAWGCLLGCYRSRLEALGWYRQILASKWSHILWAVPVICSVASGGHIVLFRLPVHFVTNPVSIGAALTILVHRSVLAPSDAIGKFLNLGIVASFGRLSYSLYLWHPLFIDGNLNTPVNHFPVNLLIAIVLAILSYNFIEQPCLSLRAKLEAKLFGKRRKLNEAEVAQTASA